MRRQLNNCKELNAGLTVNVKHVEATVGEMEHRLKPVTSMIATVSTSKENITTALTQIEGVCNEIKDMNQTIDVLQRKMLVLSKDPHYYFETMLKADQLVKNFNRVRAAQDSTETSGYYQESKELVHSLKQSLQIAIEQCYIYFKECLLKLDKEQDDQKNKRNHKIISNLL